MKVAVVGGGSTYTPELVDGFARRPALPLDELVLHDVDAERLEVVGGLAGRILAEQGFAGRLETTTDLDAARVDGASELQVLRRVVVPMAKPALAAVGLFNFLYAWNDFFGPLLYVINNPGNWTLSIALTQFRTLHRVEWNLTMAAVVLVMAPVIALFFLAQRAFIEGVTLTGVKG